MTELPKKPRGGARPGAGRPPGHKNKKTIAKEFAQRNVIDETLSRLTGEEIERLTPLQIMELGMHLMLKAGNITAAVAMAEVTPFVHPKMATTTPDSIPWPEDLQPDPPPTPDQEGPISPIL